MAIHRQLTTSDGASLIVREATLKDAEALLDGIRQVLAEGLVGIVTRPEEFRVTLDQERKWIRDLATSGRSILLVAEHSGALVGWVDVRGGNRLAERHTATLGISVLKAWRDRGVGTALLQAVIDWATAHPVVEKLKLAVTVSNDRARHLYAKLGFVEEGYLPGELKRPDGTYLDNVLMYLWVKPTRPPGVGHASAPPNQT